jgi:hypothetical protein
MVSVYTAPSSEHDAGCAGPVAGAPSIAGDTDRVAAGSDLDRRQTSQKERGTGAKLAGIHLVLVHRLS